MVRQGAVTGFAGYARVSALALQVENVRVAGLARFVTGESDWASASLVESGRPKMPVLAEIGRNNRPAYHQERDDAESQKSHHTDQVCTAPQEVLHAERLCNC